MSRKKTVITEYSIFAHNINNLINRSCGGNKKVFGDSVGASYDTVRSWCLGEYLPGGAQLIEIRKK